MKMLRPQFAAAFAVQLVITGLTIAQTSDTSATRVRPAVEKGVGYLKGESRQIKTPADAALATIALCRTGVPANDLDFQAIASRFASTFSANGYTPETRGGPDNEEAAVVLVALVNMDAVGYKSQIDVVARYILNKQLGNGAWDTSARQYGDTGMTQACLFALFEAESAGVPIPAEVWDRSATWMLTAQASAGSWNNQRDENTTDTLTMTAAGLCGLQVCQRQLARNREGEDRINPLMSPITQDGEPVQSRYKPTTTAAAINTGIQKGVTWLGKNFQLNNNPIVGESPYAFLFLLERAASLGDSKAIDTTRWFDKGVDFALSTQTKTGSWNAKQGEVANTSWSVMFGSRATKLMEEQAAVRRISSQDGSGKRPVDFSSVEVVLGQIVARPLKGEVPELIELLERPGSDQFDSAFAGLVQKCDREGSKVLRPYKNYFRKRLRTGDDQARGIAAWALGRIGDIDIVPSLIRALTDKDENVAVKAEQGLRLIRRKPETSFPPTGATPEQKLDAAKQWLAWYNAVKSPDLDAPEEILPVAK